MLDDDMDDDEEELEINDDEELDDEEEEEEEIIPMQQPINPFMGLSPASITNAALALANVAAAKSNQQQQQQQQLSSSSNELEQPQPDQEMKRQPFNLLGSGITLVLLFPSFASVKCKISHMLTHGKLRVCRKKND